MNRTPVVRALIIILISVFLFFSLSTRLPAQETVRSSVPLEELLKEALANNRGLEAAREELQAAKHRVPQASALPDPTAGYAVMGPMLETPLGPQKDVYEFEQMIPFPGKLLERRKIALSEVDAASARLKQVERELVLNISQTYYDLYAVDAAIAAVEEILDLLKKFEAVAESRYASRQGEQRDVAKAQAKVSGTLQELFVLRQQRQTLAAFLNALLDRRALAPIDKIRAPVLPKLELSLDQLLKQSRENRPELLEAAAMRGRQGHAHALAKYEYMPDISVGFQYTRIGGGMTTGPNDGRDAWMVPLKVTLPLWQNRIIPAVLEAKRNLNASEANLRQAENLAEYEIKNAYYRFTAGRQVVELYENALIPQAKLAFSSDQAGYEAGRTDVLNFLDSEEVYRNAKIAYYQALADALKNFAAIERAVGIDMEK
ncbi:MAG: TolC family protein [Candidatus Omnitrophica bacterium]|nr:TolC family protein [Candidatus Omnitrophota bacterium]